MTLSLLRKTQKTQKKQKVNFLIKYSEEPILKQGSAFSILAWEQVGKKYVLLSLLWKKTNVFISGTSVKPEV